MIIVEINISEGNNQNLIKEFEKTLNDWDIHVIDINSDPSHNRSVFTFTGENNLLIKALREISLLAIENIDMRKHTGNHPRLGAVDVAAFIPESAKEMEDAIELANRYGEILADMGVPVYFYEKNARSLERENLPSLRAGEYEKLEERLLTGEFNPDLGPEAFNDKTGASIVGARMPLIAFNINLNTSDLSIGKEIAERIRFSSGGLPYVRAIALELEDTKLIQVSMNLTDYRKTSISLVYETIKDYAEEFNIEILNSELVGHIPKDALISLAEDYLKVDSLENDQIY